MEYLPQVGVGAWDTGTEKYFQGHRNEVSPIRVVWKDRDVLSVSGAGWKSWENSLSLLQILELPAVYGLWCHHFIPCLFSHRLFHIPPHGLIIRSLGLDWGLS